jgi:hypothetical protein
MRKMTGFFVSGLLLVALAGPAGAGDTGSATGHRAADAAATAPTIAPVETAPARYEPNRHGYHGDRHDRDGRSYYRDGRRYHDDGRYHYRDGRYHYRDGYSYGDDNYYRGRPTPDCPSGEWTYHPNTGWMCAG